MVTEADAFEVVAPGMLTTVQDLGRWGWQRYGVPVSGAMDPFALEVGNLLVGNERGTAALESALTGPTLRVLSRVVVAVCGAARDATLDEAPLPAWQSVEVRPGQLLALGPMKAGVWAYLCISGGIEVPIVLGSRSTCLRAGFGGLDGRSLRSGDVVRCGPVPRLPPAGRGLPRSLLPEDTHQGEVRAVPGPQEEIFTTEALAAFFSKPFTVTPQSDRMGYRLEGPRLRLRATSQILSEGAAAGSVQVPDAGQPIVLMADRPPTGGYPKIAAVISPDLRLIAQLSPGSTVRFRRASLQEAQEAVHQRETAIQRISAGFAYSG